MHGPPSTGRDYEDCDGPEAGKRDVYVANRKSVMDMGSVDRLARALGRAAQAASLGSRTLTRLDTNPVPSSWRHITKIDPEDEKKLPLLYPLYLSHTSAVSVGGSRDVNSTNTEETFDLLEYTNVPVFHEPSAARHVTEHTREQSRFLAIPEVLNGDSEALIGTLGEGTEYLREELVPEMLARKAGWLPVGLRGRLVDWLTSWFLSRAVFEAYIIQNPDSAAAREAAVTAADVLTPSQAGQRALAAERHLGSEVIYVEYSGTYGGEEAVELLEAVRGAVSWSRIWYGGGLSNRTDVEAVLEAGADAVVVGNIFHEIAEEEAAMFPRAAAEIGMGCQPAEITAWLDEEVEYGESKAARYLQTVPDAIDPRAAAKRYLELSAHLWFALHRWPAEANDQSTTQDPPNEGPRAEINALPGYDDLTTVAGPAARDLLRSYTAYLAGEESSARTATIEPRHVGGLGVV